MANPIKQTREEELVSKPAAVNQRPPVNQKVKQAFTSKI